jgi:hypothetical protein
LGEPVAEGQVCRFEGVSDPLDVVSLLRNLTVALHIAGVDLQPIRLNPRTKLSVVARRPSGDL